VGGVPPTNLWHYDETGHTDEAKKEILSLFDGKAVFDTPKPTRLIERVLQIATDTDSLVLDSFAGSGTTAQAVLNANARDGGNRRFILVELNDYAERVTAERTKRVITGYGEGRNAHSGTGKYYVVEADESDKSFRHLSPAAVLVTNIEVKKTPKIRKSDRDVIRLSREATPASGRSTFSRLKPSSTQSIIRSVPRVRQSMSRSRAFVGGVMISAAAAASRESVSISSFFRKAVTCFMGRSSPPRAGATPDSRILLYEVERERSIGFVL
jgi:hypothetical protein